MATQLDRSWNQLFEKYRILEAIESNGNFIISADQIREFREPRLMTKFDHKESLPKIFADNELSILPISRNKYLISNHKIFNELKEPNNIIEKIPFPTNIQSIIPEQINSETIALNCSYLSGMLTDFLEDEEIYPTVSGRMSSKKFKFEVLNTKTNLIDNIDVENSQIEIDGAYEGVSYLSLIEAKREIASDFLIRQLYYPYRLWSEKVTKKIKLIYLIYSNDIFSFFEYQFQDKNNYNSLVLIKQKNYSFEDTTITIKDIEDILYSVKTIEEPEVPFPQADSIKRVINLCELLDDKEMTRSEIVEEYQFHSRQAEYYANAGKYLSIFEKGNSLVKLTDLGKSIMKKKYVNRQLGLVKQMLEHKIFNTILRLTFERGKVLDIKEIAFEMKKAGLYGINSDSTFERRAQTVKKWVDWITGLIEE
ncbi:MAG: type II restriction endonuclease [Erysipelotrichales bacterium]|nr:type II restriction endonuclease [Erysipelotrichales bacterium]